MSCLPLEEPAIDFNLDFHATPFRGQKSDLEKHWVPKSHRGQPAVMAFVAQEESRRVMVYATANLLRQEADSMVVRFVDHWKELTGRYPGRLMFDSRATWQWLPYDLQPSSFRSPSPTLEAKDGAHRCPDTHQPHGFPVGQMPPRVCLTTWASK